MAQALSSPFTPDTTSDRKGASHAHHHEPARNQTGTCRRSGADVRVRLRTEPRWSCALHRDRIDRSPLHRLRRPPPEATTHLTLHHRSERSTPITPPLYTRFASEYHLIVGELATQTWDAGILADVPRFLTGSKRPTVVDLGAGTGIGGRLLKHVEPALYRIGVDRSAAMLRSAHDAYDQLVCGDITRGYLEPTEHGRIDAIVSGFDTLNYLPPTDLDVCLRTAAAYLRPGGALIFDYSSPALLEQAWKDTSSVDDLGDSGTFHWRHQWSETGGCAVSTIERRDRHGRYLWAETHTQYAVDAAAMAALAHEAGFAAVTVRDLNGTRFTPEAHTHVWTLTKAEAPHG